MEKISKITVIIPALNEEKNIVDVIKELKVVGFSDILVIDGNSHDNTANVCRELGANVIFQDGKGKGDALRKGFVHKGLGDFVVMLDADGSMNPKEIDLFLDAFKNGVDVVKGSRFMSPGFSEDLNLVRRIGNTIMVKIVNLLWGTNYTDLCYGYAAFRREAIQKICPSLDSKFFEIEAELFIKAIKMGLKVQEVPSVELRRKTGKSHLKVFTDGFKIFKTIFVEALNE
jgi:glycosyltransferase involved in cell wall biosynthesis